MFMVASIFVLTSGEKLFLQHKEQECRHNKRVTASGGEGLPRTQPDQVNASSTDLRDGRFMRV